MLIAIEKLPKPGEPLYTVRIKQHIDFASGITDKVITFIKDTDIPHSIINEELIIADRSRKEFEETVIFHFGNDCRFKYRNWKFS